MNKADRLEAVLQMIGRDSGVTVAGLSRAAGVSEVTIRKDLQLLERQGRIRRSYGKVALTEADPAAGEMPGKRRIGALAASLVADEELLFIGPGVTCLELARGLASRQRLSVITMNVSAAQALAGAPEIRLLTLPGDFTRRNGTYYVTGAAAAEYAAGLYVDKAFITADGLDLERGFSVLDEVTAQIYRALVKAGTRVFACVPAARFGRNARAALGPLEYAAAVITDAPPDPAFAAAFAEKGVELLIAGPR